MGGASCFFVAVELFVQKYRFGGRWGGRFGIFSGSVFFIFFFLLDSALEVLGIVSNSNLYI